MAKKCKMLLVMLLVFSMAMFSVGCGGDSTDGDAAIEGEWTPSQDITIVVPYSAGGGTDNTIRAIQSALSDFLGVNVIVSNEPASSGVVGAKSVAEAKPDGYTLLCTAAGAICYQNHYEGTGYDLDNFTPIARVSVGPELICVRADSDIQTYDDLVAAMKEKTLTVGSTAVGAAAHVALMSFCNDIGANVNYVPYNSGSEAMIALLGGQTDVCIGGSQQIVSQLASGEIRIVANLGSLPGVGYEDVAIASQNGCKTNIDTFNALLGPAGMDPAIVEKLEEAVQYALEDEATKKALEAAGIELGYLGADDFAPYLSGYNETVGDVLEEIGLV